MKFDSNYVKTSRQISPIMALLLTNSLTLTLWSCGNSSLELRSNSLLAYRLATIPISNLQYRMQVRYSSDCGRRNKYGYRIGNSGYGPTHPNCAPLILERAISLPRLWRPLSIATTLSISGPVARRGGRQGRPSSKNQD